MQVEIDDWFEFLGGEETTRQGDRDLSFFACLTSRIVISFFREGG